MGQRCFVVHCKHLNIIKCRNPIVNPCQSQLLTESTVCRSWFWLNNTYVMIDFVRNSWFLFLWSFLFDSNTCRFISLTFDCPAKITVIRTQECLMYILQEKKRDFELLVGWVNASWWQVVCEVSRQPKQVEWFRRYNAPSTYWGYNT